MLRHTATQSVQNIPFVTKKLNINKIKTKIVIYIYIYVQLDLPFLIITDLHLSESLAII